MFKNHIKLVLRKLKREKLYSFVNIFGLTIGLTAFLLISLYVRDELSFDQFHDKSNDIYRVVSDHERFGKKGIIYSDFVEFFAPDMPEIEAYNRLAPLGEKALVSHNQKRYNVSGVYQTDSNFFELFSFELKNGSKEAVFSNSGQAVISEELSKRIFGDSNPVGQEIEIDKREKYLITGVVFNNPSNSTIQFEMLLYKQDHFKNDFENRGGVSTVVTYISAHKEHDKESIVKHINGAKERPPYKIFTENIYFDLLPLADQRLYAPYEGDVFEKNDVRYVKLFSGIGLVVLLLAIINYINLVTAQSVQRMKEVGLRKIIGAGKKELVAYQLVESVSISMLSFLLAFGVAEQLMPVFNDLLQKDIAIAYFSLEFFIWVAIAGLILGILAGLYPAFYISRVKPLKLLEKGSGIGKGGKWLKKGLALTQFTVTAILISVLAIMNSQMNFLKEKELGFDTNFVVEIPLERDSTHLYQTLKNEFLTISNVENVSVTGFSLGGGWVTGVMNKSNIMGEGAEGVADDMIRGDQDLMKTLEMDFYWKADNYSTDQFDENQMLINYTLAEKMEWLDAPEGRRLYQYNDQVGKEVVGIVEDIHFKSLKESIEPLVIYPLGSWGNDKLLVKMKGLNGLNEIDRMREVYQRLFDRPFEYAFLDDKVEAFYKKEAGQFKLFQMFSVLAVFISLLGLIALTTYMLVQKRKEVSIRKVLGASMQRLVLMLNREYSILILISFLIATPIAYYAMEGWLEEFKYRVTVSPLIFVGAFVGFLALSWFLTLGQSLKVSNENPADVLREE